jgi:predicted O-methyltransferase YrrM
VASPNSPSSLHALWSLLALPGYYAGRLAAQFAQSLGYHLVKCTIHCPIPSVPPFTSPVWTRVGTLAGITLDTAAHLTFLESTLAPYLHEFRPPVDPTGRSGEFYLFNGFYQVGDAELLWAMIRHAKPRRLIEVGAGYSTLVSAAACHANARDGHPVEFVSIDPAPRTSLDPARPGLTRVEQRSVTSVPLERFQELERGDILFIDSSHTVRLGSDVNFLILEVLPRLAPGVLVHLHDIFLPYEYPRAWFDRGMYLNEQYLLQAYLVGNPTYEILFAAHAVDRAAGERFAKAIPSLRLRAEAPLRKTFGPAAFWLRRRG